MNSSPMYMEYVDDADPGPDRRRGWRVVAWVSIVLSVVMVAGSLSAYGAYRKLNGNVKRDDIEAQLGSDRPAKLNNALNILLLGSDTRDGANSRYGRSLKGEPPRSDTMILLHLSPGGGQAVGISFPRDLMVPIPSCRKKDGTSTPAQSAGMINSSFTIGGPACTIRTIESFSRIKIDHFMQVDFSGFKNVVNAIGGVEICLPKDVNDPQANLFLRRGKHVVKGEQALGYVRTRKGLGDGSDLSRIKRQQQFLGSVAKKALTAGVLSNPKKLYALLSAGTKSLTTDKGLTTDVMIQIASGMQDMTAGKLRFITVPWGAYVLDPNRVQLRQPAADQFFTSIRNDTTPPEEPKKGAAPAIPPSQVKVRVYNGTTVPGLAGRVTEQLEAQGFQVILTGDLGGRQSALSQVRYGSTAQPQALTLHGKVPSAKLAVRATGSPGVVDLIIGRDWTSTSLKGGRTVGIPRQSDEVRADGNICKS